MPFRGRDAGVPARSRIGAAAALLIACVLMALAAADAGGAPPPPPPAPPPPPPEAEPEPLPNILIVISDEQRATRDSLKVMPAMRRFFGGGGTKFSNAFVTSPVCCPSRTSILTGQYAHNHRVRTNGLAHRFPHRESIVPYLKRAGYRTAIFGKFMNGWNNRRLPRFFDRGFLGFDSRHRDADKEGLGAASEDFIWGRVWRFLRRQERREDDVPWLLVIGARAAHGPFDPPRRYEHAPVGGFKSNPAVRRRFHGKVPALRAPITNISRAHPGRRPEEVRRLQLRQFMALDDLIGRTARRLRRFDEAEDLLGFYISDNGFALGEYGIVDKFLPYTVSVKVPMFMRWPDHVEAGAIDDRLVANIDIAPTIFEATGIEPKYDIDGHTLFDPAYERQLLLLEQYSRGPHGVPTWRSLRTNEWMYVRYSRRHARKSNRRPFEEYYLLNNDPWQIHNLLLTRKGFRPNVAELRKTLNDLRHCKGEECP